MAGKSPVADITLRYAVSTQIDAGGSLGMFGRHARRTDEAVGDNPAKTGPRSRSLGAPVALDVDVYHKGQRMICGDCR